MSEECWRKWEEATDRLDLATQVLESSLCGPPVAKLTAERVWVNAKQKWDYWRRKCGVKDMIEDSRGQQGIGRHIHFESEDGIPVEYGYLF